MDEDQIKSVFRDAHPNPDLQDLKRRLEEEPDQLLGTAKTASAKDVSFFESFLSLDEESARESKRAYQTVRQQLERDNHRQLNRILSELLDEMNGDD